MTESEEEKSLKKSISMPVSMWAFLEIAAAQTTQKNLSKMLQLLVEKEQRERSKRYTWTDFTVHLVEEEGSTYQTLVKDKMSLEGFTPLPAASTENRAPAGKPSPTPPESKPSAAH